LKTYFFIITLLLHFSSLWATDINATLLDANSSVYQKLFTTISKQKNHSPEIVLEKSLLHILTEPQKIKIGTFPTQVKDALIYKSLFQLYLNNTLALNTIETKLKQNNNKIKAIEDEIANLDSKAPQLLSTELQDAFYHKKNKFYNQQIDVYKKQLKQIQKLLLNSLANVNLQKYNNDKQLTKEMHLLKVLKTRLNQYTITKEKFELLNNSAKIASTIKQMQTIKNAYKNILKSIIVTNFMHFSLALQKKDEAAFSIAKNINAKLELLKIDNANTYIPNLLQNMETKYLGRLKTITGSSEQELKELIYNGWNFINQPIFEINKIPISIFKLSLALFIFIFGFLLGAFYKYKIKNLSISKDSLTAPTRALIANIGYYIIILIAFFTALNILGVTLSSLAIVAGALSVGIGFGLQNIVSNFVSGLILMFERSIKIGDYVQLNDTTRGYVTDIRMRSTTIKTNENIDIIVPNQTFIENDVINWTMKDNIRRFSIPFGVKYGTKPEDVIEIIEKAVAESELNTDLENSHERQTRVIMTGMGDSSVNFELFIWVRGDSLRKPKRTASEFYILIYNALYENNIEIPFPQMDLHLRSVDATLPIQTQNNNTKENK